MENLRIVCEKYTGQDEYFQLVQDLINELSQEDNKKVSLNKSKIDAENRDNSLRIFIALSKEKMIGILCLKESFSFFANGNYGIINELYIKDNYRSLGIGKKLLESALKYGQSMGWQRIDVTAPPGSIGEEALDFYKKNGFEFTGPKLKYSFHSKAEK